MFIGGGQAGLRQHRQVEPPMAAWEEGGMYSPGEDQDPGGGARGPTGRLSPPPPVESGGGGGGRRSPREPPPSDVETAVIAMGFSEVAVRSAQTRGNYSRPDELLSAVVSKNDEFCIKNEKLCIKNEEFCI